MSSLRLLLVIGGKATAYGNSLRIKGRLSGALKIEMADVVIDDSGKALTDKARSIGQSLLFRSSTDQRLRRIAQTSVEMLVIIAERATIQSVIGAIMLRLLSYFYNQIGYL